MTSMTPAEPLLTAEELDELERLAEKATPGPWRADGDEYGADIFAGPLDHTMAFVAVDHEGLMPCVRRRQDADLIVALVNAAPALLAAARATTPDVTLFTDGDKVVAASADTLEGAKALIYGAVPAARATTEPGLDAAWQEAEAALPEGATLAVSSTRGVSGPFVATTDYGEPRHVADPRVVNLRDFPPNGHGRYGRDLPPDVVRIDRRGPWGNPYKITAGAPGLPSTIFGVEVPTDRAGVIARFREYAERHLRLEPGWLEPLRGKRLACWCAPEPCHGDVLLELLDR